MDTCTCAQCAHFIRDQIGDGHGIGQCAELNRYIAAISGQDKPTQERLIEKAKAAIGCGNNGALMWPNAARHCAKFAALAK